mmetsp:Transcript_6723/g.15692  ORF Transcript_6723/g.15692 Transcript_6723/m.15692 type:complete len:226 (-) Transcript_6723:9-686(-)
MPVGTTNKQVATMKLTAFSTSLHHGNLFWPICSNGCPSSVLIIWKCAPITPRYATTHSHQRRDSVLDAAHCTSTPSTPHRSDVHRARCCDRPLTAPSSPKVARRSTMEEAVWGHPAIQRRVLRRRERRTGRRRARRRQGSSRGLAHDASHLMAETWGSRARASRSATWRSAVAAHANRNTRTMVCWNCTEVAIPCSTTSSSSSSQRCSGSELALEWAKEGWLKAP